jgi:hypothetical protein
MLGLDAFQIDYGVVAAAAGSETNSRGKLQTW